MTPGALLATSLFATTMALVCAAYALDLMPAARSDVRARVLPGKRSARVEAATRLSTERPDLGWRRALILPSKLVEMERNLALANKSPSMLPTLLLIKGVAPIVMAFMGWSFAPYINGFMPNVVFWLLFFASYQYPDIYIAARATERQAEMMLALPDILDQVTIALDAGMSFEAAFARVGRTHEGPLGPQIQRTVQDMAVGMSRREAYLALAARNDIPDLSRFVRSLVQAEEFGVPISQVVRLQAEEMRDKRRQRAAAKAKTVPLKLLFPMLGCLLPVLFIILLTPSVILLGERL